MVKGDGPSLLGRDWLRFLRLDWREICSIDVTKPSKINQILGKFENVFKPGLGTFKGITVDIDVSSQVQPKFYKARSVPFALKGKIEQELEHLLAQGVISPVKSAKCAAPIFPVLKKNGNVRICGDYKLTANISASVDAYPLPKIEDLFTDLSGGKTFTKLDLAQAYLQLPLSEDSKPLTTINTHRGLYQYNRMPFGISSAPSIFQRTMDNLLKGIPEPLKQSI